MLKNLDSHKEGYFLWRTDESNRRNKSQRDRKEEKKKQGERVLDTGYEPRLNQALFVLPFFAFAAGFPSRTPPSPRPHGWERSSRCPDVQNDVNDVNEKKKSVLTNFTGTGKACAREDQGKKKTRKGSVHCLFFSPSFFFFPGGPCRVFRSLVSRTTWDLHQRSGPGVAVGVRKKKDKKKRQPTRTSLYRVYVCCHVSTC